MTAHFSVVQYVPDPIADERMNIGVIALGDDGVRCRFLRDWERVERFGGKDIGFLKEFAYSVEQTMLDQNRLLPAAPPLDLAVLGRMASGWINSIQLTPPRGSVLDGEALLASVVGDFLKEHTPTTREARNRRTIAIEAELAFSDALVRRFGTPAARDLVTRDYRYTGRRDGHDFDVAVRNGEVFLGAYAISFELATTAYLHDRVKITAWDLSDVRAADPDLELAVIASSPEVDHRQYAVAKEFYAQTERICTDYGASLIPRQDLFKIAAEVAERVPEAAIPADLGQF